MTNDLWPDASNKMVLDGLLQRICEYIAALLFQRKEIAPAQEIVGLHTSCVVCDGWR